MEILMGFQIRFIFVSFRGYP